MIETHSFKVFIPPNTQYLILGSFTGRMTPDNVYDWFYGTKRNQFWPIMEEAFGIELKTLAQKQRLFKTLGIAITDIILSCERKVNSNLDVNLTNIVFNTEAINNILHSKKIKAIFFSSRFVERLFKRLFKDFILKRPEVELTTLPSPSPRYAAMSRAEKVKKYHDLLPKL